ncbi:MAG: CRISPR-associated endoribonuclease Cas6 [Exilispira sp.]
MRFSCKIFLKRETNISKDYRSHLLSLIKEAIKRSGSDGEEFYDRFYSGNNTKPFTFSAYFPLKDGRLNEDFFTFYFSTNDYEFLMRVYNGFMNINKSKDFQLFDNKSDNESDKKIEIKNFFLMPERRFDIDVATFKTLSPFLVRDIEDGKNYLYPKGFSLQTKDQMKEPTHWKSWIGKREGEFLEAMEFSLSSMLNKMGYNLQDIKITLDDKSTIVPIIHGSGNKDHPFQMTFPGIKGLLTIKAEPEILKLIYDIGIGARRSEGFGMLEVVE